jgi:hypothetical protein
MKLGGLNIVDFKLGNTQVNSIYQGNNLVWTKGVLLLDLYPNAAAAYDLIKLRTVYTGAAIRVRRSSDNTEMDIGFSDNILNTAALLSFCGSGSGFVSVWYDQGLSGLNLTQITAARQPRIVNAGSMEVMNTKPCVRFISASNNFLSGGNILSVGIGNSLLGIAVASMVSNNAIYAKAVATASANRYGLISEALLTSILFDSANNANNVTAALPTGQRLFAQEFKPFTSNRLWVNNINIASNTTSIGELGTRSTRFLLGAYSNATDTGEVIPLNGTVQNLILFIGPTLPSTTAVGTEINKYYAIY